MRNLVRYRGTADSSKAVHGDLWVRDLARRFVVLRTCFQPDFFRPPQRAFGAGACFAELGGLLGVAREQIRQGKRGVDLGDDAVDALDFGLRFGNPLLQRRPLFVLAALEPVVFLEVLFGSLAATVTRTVPRVADR